MGLPSVVIVGGGASGALAAIHLLRLARADGTPVAVTLLDAHGRHATGQAYSTADPGHLLNTRAELMSALDGEPGHLVAWARANGFDTGGFLPRPAYGRYLREVLAAAEDPPGRPLHRVTATAVALEPRTGSGPGPADGPGTCLGRAPGSAAGLGPGTDTGPGLGPGSGTGSGPGPGRRTGPGPGSGSGSGHDPGSGARPGFVVRLADGGRVAADAVVLALGNRAPAALPGVPAHPRYVADPWARGALAGIGDGTPVLVVGTGLTMVDVALTATRANPDTVVYALSRHGLLPRPHPAVPAAPVPVALPEGPLRAAGLVAAVRRAVRGSGGEWHGVVDGLRPRVQELWQRLAPEERRLFLRRFARYWEIHRHRIPPEAAAAIADLRERGRLRLLRGRLRAAAPAPSGLRVRADLDGTPADLDVGWLVNATGPGADVTTDPFLAHLVATGTARPDPLYLGLDATADGAVLDATGHPHDRLFTLGPPLRGIRYETTAVPEIRTQAAALAPRLLHALRPTRTQPVA